MFVVVEAGGYVRWLNVCHWEDESFWHAIVLVEQFGSLYLPRSCFGQGPVLGNFFKLLTNFARLAFVLNHIGWYS